ncbi:polyprenyl synthetase family protein [candidate division NPL-UPA2 bacterium]|nr:polyprenyl synthetase family protein [candidate division NPL-UPA2 bacterium]
MRGKAKGREAKTGNYCSDRVAAGVDFQAYWEKKKKLIDEALDGELPRENEPPAIIHQAMRYALFPGGKRLRPLLTLAAAEAVGGDSRKVLPTACALELIHAYSLIHDDLPALDNDHCRRGKPSSHKAFGEDIAILAGDALLTLAFGLISKNGEEEGVDKNLIPLVIGEVARAVGTLGMIGGQVDDLKMTGKEVAPDQLESIHRRKTGALLGLCLKVGAILGGGKQEEIESLSCYGRDIGLAFQIGDDILDAKEEGKGKTTYPALLGLEESRRSVVELIEKAKEELIFLKEGGDILRKMADVVLRRSLGCEDGF